MSRTLRGVPLCSAITLPNVTPKHWKLGLTPRFEVYTAVNRWPLEKPLDALQAAVNGWCRGTSKRDVRPIGFSASARIPDSCRCWTSKRINNHRVGCVLLQRALSQMLVGPQTINELLFAGALTRRCVLWSLAKCYAQRELIYPQWCIPWTTLCKQGCVLLSRDGISGLAYGKTV